MDRPTQTPAEPQKGQRGLRKGLSNRHIQLIALGGAIGTGLFVGSGEAISLSGPSVILAYLIGGIAIFFILRALGEMSVHNPQAGAFSYYASRYWSRRAGFVSGWNYWFSYILISMVQLAVVGRFVNFWLPAIPQWVSAIVFLVLIAAANLLGVGKFGEFEFWFAIIKVVAVVAMIVAGIIVIFLGLPGLAGTHASVGNLVDIGNGAGSGFTPFGLFTPAATETMASDSTSATGLLMALVVVMFSFGGTELVGVTAGEAENPKKTLPKAINGVMWKILVFYVGTMFVIMCVIPWTAIDQSMSPFVQIFSSVGFQGAAQVLNFICITAVISVYNSGLYSNSRVLFSLAEQGNAPKFLRRLSKNGVPVAGVLVSTAITGIAVIVVFLWPEFAFNYLMAIATIAAIVNWGMVIITQWKFRRELDAAGQRAEFRMPFASVARWFVLIFLAVVVVFMWFSPSYRMAVVIGPIWIVVLIAAFQITQRQRRKQQAR